MAGFSPTVEAFSISHAQILDGTTDFLSELAAAYNEESDIYGVKEGKLEPDMGDFDNEGDDQVLSTWSWVNKADVSIQSGYLSFPLIAKLTGQPITSSVAGGKSIQSLDLWHEDSFNSGAYPMILKMPSKDKNGLPADFVIGLYKVTFKPIQFDGPAYKDGLKVNYDGTSVASLVDEKGVPFPDGKKRFGKLLSIQR